MMLKTLQLEKYLNSLEDEIHQNSRKVEEQLKEFLVENPQNSHAHLLMGQCRFLNNEISAAKASFETVLATLPKSTDALLALAKVCYLQEDIEQAVKYLLSITNQRPEIAECWQLLGEYFRALGDNIHSQKAKMQFEMVQIINAKVAEAENAFLQGDFNKSDQICRLLLKQIPNETRALRLLSKLALHAGHFEDHLFLLEKSKTLRSEDVNIGIEYANALMYNKQPQKALTECQRLIELCPQNIDIYAVKAAALISLSNYIEAAEIYAALSEVHDNRALCLLRLGNTQKIIGQAQQAINSFKKAIECDPLIGESYWNLANLKIYQFTNEEIEEMQRLINRPNLTEKNQVLIHFALGKALEDQQNFEQSFNHYKVANDSYIKTRNYRYASRHKALMNFFTEDFFANKKDFGHPSEEPIFIVGLPRSGSTLVEQILSSHSQVDGTIEMTEIVSIARDLNRTNALGQGQFFNSLQNLSANECHRLGERYLDYTKPLRQNAPFFIDKLPANFHHIGLVKTLFPNAKIIDVRRNPMGSGWSLYKHFFAEGSEYSYNLENIARYYNDYVELMDHWNTVLPGQILSLTYEGLVENLGTNTRQILDYCGLEYEESCLNFYNNKRAVATPSSEQVRMPIYTNALNQWQNYRAFLKPLEDLIAARHPVE